jgi:hypothetical protein
MDMLNHLLVSQVDHLLVRKLKAYTEPNLLVCLDMKYRRVSNDPVPADGAGGQTVR